MQFAVFQVVGIILMLGSKSALLFCTSRHGMPYTLLSLHLTCSAPPPPFPSLLANLAVCQAATAQANPHGALPAMQLAWVVLSCPLHACACGCPCMCAACWSLQGQTELLGSLMVPTWGVQGWEQAQLCPRLAKNQQGNPQSGWLLAHPSLVALHLSSVGNPN